MEFNSIEYICFLAIIFFVFQIAGQKMKLLLLLAASYFFYGCWNVKYTFLIIGITLISYLSALGMERHPQKKKIILGSSVFIFIAFLFVFKYFDFGINIFNSWMEIKKSEIRISNFNILLPVGISFYTFQAISYVADVYKGNCKIEKNFLKYALYIAFFPQLVAGPIERADHIIPQFNKKYQFDYQQITDGMILIAWGLFKKMVIADELAVYVDKIYGSVDAYTGFALVIATVMFAIQIYCDFSGYSDIAVGSAKLFGINLMTNFKTPYLSSSLQEFWTRWHISLSQWLRDYVYIPLGGGRKGKIRADINLLCTFLASGLWHGANMTFVIWGGYLGLVGIAEKNIKWKKKGKIGEGIGIIITFIICCSAWIFFRSDDLGDAKYIILHMAENIIQFKQYIFQGWQAVGMDQYKKIQLGISMLVLFVADICQKYGMGIGRIRKLPVVIRWTIYLLLVLCILLFSRKGGVQFVYFQF